MVLYDCFIMYFPCASELHVKISTAFTGKSLILHIVYIFNKCLLNDYINDNSSVVLKIIQNE